MSARHYPPLRERFFAKVQRTETCWLWLGARDRHGYGRFWLNGRNAHAIRVAYALEVGELDPALVLDHRCRIKRCVRPDHLDPVPKEVNNSRGIQDRGRDPHGRFKSREASEEFWGT